MYIIIIFKTLVYDKKAIQMHKPLSHKHAVSYIISIEHRWARKLTRYPINRLR